MWYGSLERLVHAAREHLGVVPQTPQKRGARDRGRRRPPHRRVVVAEQPQRVEPGGERPHGSVVVVQRIEQWRRRREGARTPVGRDSRARERRRRRLTAALVEQAERQAGRRPHRQLARQLVAIEERERVATLGGKPQLVA